MNYKYIYNEAYKYMDQKILEEDCGLLCNSHCCRNTMENGEKIGIYLMPFEYESIFMDTELKRSFKYEKHSSMNYHIPKRVKYLYYIYCSKEAGCLRSLRPIQCRTYPFEPHLQDDKLSLVVEDVQIHQCPLIDRIESWRKEFITGIYLGWERLIQIPEVRYLIEYDSERRLQANNIRYLLKDLTTI